MPQQVCNLLYCQRFEIAVFILNAVDQPRGEGMTQAVQTLVRDSGEIEQCVPP